MSSILLLTRLQVAQVIGGYRAALEKRTGLRGSLAISTLIGLAIFGGLAWLGHRAFGLVGGLGLDATIYNMLFLACGSITFALTLPAVMGAFFASTDIYDLLPLPVSPFAIAFSKTLSSLASGYVWTVLFIAAPLAGWGIAAGAGVSYWLAYVLAVVFTPFLPVAYAGTLSIVMATVFKRLRRKDTITTLSTVLAVGMSLGFYFLSSSLRNNDDPTLALGGISQATQGMLAVFPAYGFAVRALSQPDPLACALFVLLSLLFFAVFVGVARVLYLRIITSLTAGAGKARAFTGEAGQQQRPLLGALALTEAKRIVRNSTSLVNNVLYPIAIMPAIFALSFSSGTLTDLGKRLPELGDVTTIATGFGLALFMFLGCMSALTNRIAATCVSREGSNWVHMKFIPVPMQTQLLAKVLPGFAVNAVVALLFMGAAAYVFVVLAGMDPLMIVWGLVIMLAGFWLSACLAALGDSKHPHVDWGNDGEVNARTLKGGGTLKPLLVTLAYSLAPILASPVTGLDPRVFLPVIALVCAGVALFGGRALLARAAQNLEAFE